MNPEPCPCKDCIVRGRFAIGLDMHFCGDDCPYKCDAYDNWKRRAGEGEEDKHDYSDMNAKDLYALCKQKGIEVEAKRSKEYYLEKLA